MNIKLFNELLEGRKSGPRQRSYVWKTFLQICEIYLKEHKVKNPIVVELGIMRNKQKKFYEQLLDAEHIGIDISNIKGIPDILGNTHDSKTLTILESKLKKRPIDILFIDANHSYDDVKKDFEMYSLLCNGIIVLDDINLSRHRIKKRKRHGVWKFWDEIKLLEKYDDYLFLSIGTYRDSSGMGMVIKRG